MRVIDCEKRHELLLNEFTIELIKTAANNYVHFQQGRQSSYYQHQSQQEQPRNQHKNFTVAAFISNNDKLLLKNLEKQSYSDAFKLEQYVVQHYQHHQKNHLQNSQTNQQYNIKPKDCKMHLSSIPTEAVVDNKQISSPRPLFHAKLLHFEPEDLRKSESVNKLGNSKRMFDASDSALPAATDNNSSNVLSKRKRSVSFTAIVNATNTNGNIDGSYPVKQLDQYSLPLTPEIKTEEDTVTEANADLSTGNEKSY
ncbi:uncharacterized protein LOC119643682 [Glossina fuscipes]|uniref:Uncharacterized protein LOC119643682 n=1 Tax=Glossina fuscipes TaxID=7396 RepID=A0A9C5ZG64_9MUSC|nr:uncharacterized protein LOC119643682 [Glossina fuscipes]